MADAGELIAVRRGERELRFRPCGGRIEATLRANQFYEQGMLDYIAALGLRGVYVDAGSYIGTHAIYFAAFCAADRVVAFEPRPNCLEHLRHNIEVNGLGDRITVHPFGLSDRDETVTVRLDRRDVSFECHRLDSLVTDPVAVMKLDVEGMETKVLAGATGILERSRPLLFVEAHDEASLAALLAPLAPYGYQPTGRVFNHTATYELASPASPVARPARLPSTRSIIDPAWWLPLEPEVSASIDGGRLRIESRMPAEQHGHVTAAPGRLKAPPKAAFLAVTPGSVLFVEANGILSDGVGASLFIMEYRGGERTHVLRHFMGNRNFHRLELAADTERVRLTLRLTGPGVLELDRLVIHRLG
jgi:FkbM family methyltransferase